MAVSRAAQRTTPRLWERRVRGGRSYRLLDRLALSLAATVLIAPGATVGAQQPSGQSNQPSAPILPPGQGATIVGDVVAAADGRPLPYATVIVDPGNRERFADAGGSFVIGELALGSYHLRVRQIGFAARDTTLVITTAGLQKRLHIVMRIVALRLPPVVVQGERPGKCVAPGIPDSSVNPSLAALFAELQKNVQRYRLLIKEYPFQFAREEWRVNRNDAGYEETIGLDTVWYEVTRMENRPYRPGQVVVWEIGPHGNPEQYMPLPTFGYLDDPVFKAAHCFAYMGEDTTGGATPTIRVDFQPAASIQTPDLEGSVYLDEDRYIVRRAVFRITEPNRVVPPISELSVTTTFREVLPLVPLFDEVRYRRPLYKDGNAAVMEVDRLLTLKFEHGAPGARSGR
jgi:Carboxypeptidase regulatory-like domain